jgi:hypothetical protein
MGIYRRKPKTFQGGAALPDRQEFTFPEEGAASVERSKPEVAKKTKRRPHPVSFKKRPL